MIPVSVQRLSRSFGPQLAVDAVSFDVPAGTVLGLLGCNGAGKSTLIRLLAGHLIPTAGEATVVGIPIAERDPARWLRMGYVSQAKHLPEWMTGEECLDFARSFRPRWDRAYVAALTARLQVPLRQRVSTLARGHYVRLQACLALGHHPELVLLDEPTSGLDPDGRRELLAILIEEIDRAGCAVVISSHLVEDLERLADSIAILDAGRILACGTAEDLQRSRSRIAVPAALPSDWDDADRACVPGLVEWKQDGPAAVAVTSSPEDALAYLQARGLPAAAYTVPSMQQVFLESIPRRKQ